MGNDWENIFDTSGAALGDIFDEFATDALYQDHPRAAAPPLMSQDRGDERVRLPFEEI